MTLKRILAVAVFVLLALPWASAEAGWRVGIRIGVPVFYRPYPYAVYVAPGPVYVAPAPVYVPPPVYVQPAPVYVQPAPQATTTASPGLPSQPVPIR
jgi:hypothetical protein